MEACTSSFSPPPLPHLSKMGFQTELTSTTRIIAVMGPTGAGKSTFIRVATGGEDIQIGHALRSCTQHLQRVTCSDPLQGTDITFVDTPGFDDTLRSDEDILEGIAGWLQDTYRAGMKLSGILYLHRITDNRMTSTLLRNLDMLQNLCGSESFSNVILITTNWDQLGDIAEGIKHEEQLRKLYWRSFLEGGSKMARFENTISSAWNIVGLLPLDPVALTIQREMVDQGKRLSDTTAGLSSFSWFHHSAETLKSLIQRLELLMGSIEASPDLDALNKREQDRKLRKAKAKADAGLKMVEKHKLRLFRHGST